MEIGNEQADRYAKMGARSLAQPSETERQNWEDEAATLRRYLLYAVQALMLFPKIAPTKALRSQFDKHLRQEGFVTGVGAARQLLPCPPPPPPPPQERPPRRVAHAEPAQPAQCHQWSWKRTRWVCEVCLKFARGADRPAASAAPCPGHNAAFSELARNPRKHTIHLSNYSLGVVFICSKCGAYSDSGNLRKLKGECELGFTSNGAKYSWDRFSKGQHPDFKKGPAKCLEEHMSLATLLRS